jgi:hypothetical protein
MTEDEAETKWCFHFIASHTNPRQPQSQYGIEQGLPSPFSYHCIASACMAWRKSTVYIDRATGEPAIPGQAAIGDLELRYSAHGYCGLAGQPL